MIRTLLALFVLTVSPALAQSPPAKRDSLVARFYSSVSVRNPSVTTLIVPRGDGTNDTTSVPFDYELASGIAGNYGTLYFVMDYQYERQNASHFVNQEYSLRQKKTAYELGMRLRDAEEGNLYILSAYVEGKILGWVGVGVTRQHLRPWFNDGATLARISLARNTFHVMKLALAVNAEFETNPTQSRIFFSSSITNFKFGRFAVVPHYRHERVKPPNVPARSSYNGSVRLTIDI
jgi:hypothetical protein